MTDIVGPLGELRVTGAQIESSLLRGSGPTLYLTLYVITEAPNRTWSDDIILFETDNDAGGGGWCFYPRGHFYAEMGIEREKIDRLWRVCFPRPEWLHNVPMWARKADCPIKNTALGTDYEAAVQQAETVLLPAFDTWRCGDNAGPGSPVQGTLDWVFGEYRSDRRFTKLDPKTRRNHEVGFALVGGYVLKDGRRLGDVRLTAITTAITDAVYEKLLVVTDATGITRERRTTINHAMKTCSASLERGRATQSRQGAGGQSVLEDGPAVLQPRNAHRDLHRTAGVSRQGDWDGLAFARYRRVAGMGMATARGRHLRHVRRDTLPSEGTPHTVRVVHEKTREENWVPLFDDAGVPLYPELMGELDALKRERIGGLMLRRDWGERGPWPTERGDLDLMRHQVKRIIRAAGLRDELSFTSFRHGGFTEAADADLADAEIRAQGRHRSAKVPPRYAKRTMKQVDAREEAARGANGRMMPKCLIA